MKSNKKYFSTENLLEIRMRVFIPLLIVTHQRLDPRRLTVVFPDQSGRPDSICLCDCPVEQGPDGSVWLFVGIFMCLTKLYKLNVSMFSLE